MALFVNSWILFMLTRSKKAEIA